MHKRTQAFLATRAELQLLQTKSANAVRATQGPEPLSSRRTSFTSFLSYSSLRPARRIPKKKATTIPPARAPTEESVCDVLLAVRVIWGALLFAYFASPSADPLWA